MEIKAAFAAIALLIPLPVLANDPGAHMHGAARLEIAVDGTVLTLRLESPLDSLLGFEHAPRTEKQKKAVNGMAEKLRKAGDWFIPTPAARCRLATVKLESPVLTPDKKSTDNTHADLDGEFVFHCESPEALRWLDVALFDGFPRFRQIDVQVAAAQGQKAARLFAKQRRVSW